MSKKDETPAPAQPASDQPAGSEPVASRAPVPVLLIALLVSLVYWGNMYIVENGGQLDARVHAPYTNWRQLEGLKPQDETGRQIAQGSRIYGQYCGSCHMADGNGNAASGFPPLAGSEWVLAKDPSRIIRIVLNGLGGPITVKGREFGQTQMLPWRESLKDDDIATVLTFIRNSWGNKAPAVDPALVKQIRDQTAGRAGAWTAPELEAIPLKD